MIGSIIVLPTGGVAVLLLLFVLLGGWEWSALSGIASRLGRILYILALAGISLLLYFMVDAAGTRFVIQSACLWWVFAGYLIYRYQRAGRFSLRRPVWLLLLGVIALLPAWTALVYLHAHDVRVLLSMFMLIWVADTAAYFAGSKWGRKKLAVEVSPGKTWVGLFGALASAPLVVTLGVAGLGLFDGHLPAFFGVAVVTVLASVVGDLFESLMKRRSGVKDSGKLLPGHGGVLDRVDSVLAAAPVYTSGLIIMVHMQ